MSKYRITMFGKAKFIFDIEADNEKQAIDRADMILCTKDGDIEIIDREILKMED